MSIYRERIISEVHAFRTIKESLVVRREPMEPDADAVPRQEAYAHLRKAAPVDRPLPRTLTWVASLPSGVRPIALMRHYPRIANLLAAAWGDAIAFGAYMDSLLTDRRGGRQGFPEDVQRELGALALHHAQDSFARSAL